MAELPDKELPPLAFEALTLLALEADADAGAELAARLGDVEDAVEPLRAVEGLALEDDFEGEDFKGETSTVSDLAGRTFVPVLEPADIDGFTVAPSEELEVEEEDFAMDRKYQEKENKSGLN